MAGIRKTGNWRAVDRMLAQAGSRFRREVRTATIQSGRMLERTMVGHFENQDLSWAPLTPAYKRRKIREGYSEQILIRTGTLMSNIRFDMRGWNEGFVGILRGARTKDGGSLVNIAAVHEFGTADGRIPARPYVEPTLQEKADDVAQNYENAVERVFQ